jgi:hypothetical protein
MEESMTFTLTIDCDNAAFSPEPFSEVQRILTDAAERLGEGIGAGKCRDVNGNTVGEFTFTNTLEDEE